MDLILESQPITGKRKNFSKNNMGQRRERDFYETPFSMTWQLLEVEHFFREAEVLEPATGDGAIVKALKQRGFTRVTDYDLKDGFDFLVMTGKCPYIITNPPYGITLDFILKAKEIAEIKIAMLLPTDYLHGIDRYSRIFQDEIFPLSKVYTFVRRPMLGDALREDGKYRTGMQTYAWYIWDKNHKGPAQIGWIDNQKYVLKGGE